MTEHTKPDKLPTIQRPSSEAAERGLAERQRVPLEAHARWNLGPGRVDPLNVLRQGEAERVQSLLPIRWSRMAESPFAYFRGAAGVMAADLAPLPRTDLHVQLCGDAHIGNFGGFATAERNSSSMSTISMKRSSDRLSGMSGGWLPALY